MQFHLYASGGPSEGRTPYLLDLQSDLLSDLTTRLVAPVRNGRDYSFPRIEKLHLSFDLDGKEHVIFISEMAAVPVDYLSSLRGELKKMKTEILSSLDFMLTGF